MLLRKGGEIVNEQKVYNRIDGHFHWYVFPYGGYFNGGGCSQRNID